MNAIMQTILKTRAIFVRKKEFMDFWIGPGYCEDKMVTLDHRFKTYLHVYPKMPTFANLAIKYLFCKDKLVLLPSNDIFVEP